MHRVELPFLRATGSPLEQIVPVTVELHDPGVGQAVGHQDAAVLRESDVLGTSEVRLIVPGFIPRAQRKQELAAVVGEDVDLLAAVVDHPYTAVGIIRADRDFVGTGGAFEQIIPLGP